MAVSTHETRFLLTVKDRTRGVWGGLRANLAGVGRAATGLNAQLATLATIGGLGYLAKQQASASREAMAYSRALKMNIEDMSRWQFAGQTLGMDAGKIADILKDVNEKIADAYRNGGGEALEVLEGLNLNIKEINALTPDKQLLAIAQALDQVGTQGEKVQILEALASDASLLEPLLRDNAYEFRQLSAIADRTGKTITRLEADQLMEANRALAVIDATADGASQTLAVKLAPLITQVGQDFSEWVEAADTDKLVANIDAVVSSLQGAYNFVSENSEIAAGGLIGYLLFGKKGLAIVGAAAWAGSQLAKMMEGVIVDLPESQVGNPALPGGGQIADPASHRGGFGLMTGPDDGGQVRTITGIVNNSRQRTDETLQAMQENNRFQQQILEAIRKQNDTARAG